MVLGTLLAWVVAPYLLLRYGVLAPNFTRNDVLFWVMWPATGMLVAGGLTALVLRWSILVKTFATCRPRTGSDDRVPAAAGSVIGVVISGTALVVVQKVSLGHRRSG